MADKLIAILHHDIHVCRWIEIGDEFCSSNMVLAAQRSKRNIPSSEILQKINSDKFFVQNSELLNNVTSGLESSILN